MDAVALPIKHRSRSERLLTRAAGSTKGNPGALPYAEHHVARPPTNREDGATTCLVAELDARRVCLIQRDYLKSNDIRQSMRADFGDFGMMTSKCHRLKSWAIGPTSL